MLNWLVAASKLHKHRETCCTAEWPFYSFLILCLYSSGLGFHVENRKNRNIYQNCFTLFRMYVFYFVYIRLKQTDNFKTECAMTVFFHFPNVTPMNFTIEV